MPGRCAGSAPHELNDAAVRAALRDDIATDREEADNGEAANGFLTLGPAEHGVRPPAAEREGA